MNRFEDATLSKGRKPIPTKPANVVWLKGYNSRLIVIILGILIILFLGVGMFRSIIIYPRTHSENMLTDLEKNYNISTTKIKNATETKSFAPTQILPTSDLSTPSLPKIGDVIVIQSGKFIMGASKEEAVWHQNFCNLYDRCIYEDYSDMLPKHEVFLDEFWIDIHETTNDQYKECVEAGVCSNPDDSSIEVYLPADYFRNNKYAHYPVVGVTWQDAVQYCEWKGKRLPTEAECEKAARSGDQRIFPWLDSNSLPNPYEILRNLKDVNFCDKNCLLKNRPWIEESVSDGCGGPGPVLHFSPNSFGVYELSGNVQEWVQDYYSDDFYQRSPENNPVNSDYSPFRITRGGGWNNGLYHMTTVFRRASDPQKPKAFIGFRCVK